MDRITADLLAYYDQEAPSRAGRGVDPQRTEWRSGFIEQLKSEGRTDVLEIGCGPGRDAPSLAAEGLRVVGLDLSGENAKLTSAAGVPALQGSLYRLPVAGGRFDAVWTMSTLVHVPDRRFDEAMSQIRDAVAPGGLVGMGLWGGVDHEGLSDFDSFDPPRFFSARSHERIKRMLSAYGTVELFETKDYQLDTDWIYQFAMLRMS